LAASIQRSVHIQNIFFLPCLQHYTLPWLARPVFAIDITVTETATITQKIMIDLTVITVFDAAQLSVAFTWD
jgi:hypothetical protein